MAIDPKLPASEPVASIERVEAWTVSQAADVLSATSISSPTPPRPVRGHSVVLDIPLDDDATPTRSARVNLPNATSNAAPDSARPQLEALRSTYSKRREPLRRDSQKRREALLKGKEGSRRRQRWENDRLLSNPYAEPPLPQDWEVRPTYPVQTVPYFLAPLWDAQYARKQAEREEGKGGRVKSKEEAEQSDVMKELRAKLKKAKAAKALLRDLEGEVRGFVEAWDAKEKELEGKGVIEADIVDAGSETETEGDSEDEEIVFVGRNGAMSDERKRKRKEKEEVALAKDKLVFQSLLDDHGASFGRYLVHAIANYYNLKTWSVTTGNPARREAYIGLREDPRTRRPSLARFEMPRPLWACV